MSTAASHALDQSLHDGDKMGFRAVFFREVPDNTGHEWDVPIWSMIVIDARSTEDALEQAIELFEKNWPCACWSLVATNVEIQEVSARSGEDELPRSKRVLRADGGRDT